MTHYKIKSVSEDLAKPVYISEMGSFNDLPQPWREISADHYYHLAFTYMSHAIEFRQIKDFKKYLANVYIYYFHNYALGVVPPQSWKMQLTKNKENPSTLKNHEIVYTEPIRYLYIGCEHDLSEKSVGHCLHEYTCKLCGFKETVDSSG